MATDIKHAKSKKEIADEYGICTKTLAKWLRKKNLMLKRGLIDPKTQELIYIEFGNPKSS
jgi:hypothetical protein